MKKVDKAFVYLLCPFWSRRLISFYLFYSTIRVLSVVKHARLIFFRINLHNKFIMRYFDV